MRSPGKWISAAATVILTGLLILPAVVSAQSGVTPEGKRKVKTRVAAVYPELARRMNVTGKVKIEVVIAPDGYVKSTRVIGGHPLLVNPAVDAVKEWKFVAASEETTQIVEIEFKSNDN
jgi:TonB family protein